jgi:hypothetical protein
MTVVLLLVTGSNRQGRDQWRIPRRVSSRRENGDRFFNHGTRAKREAEKSEIKGRFRSRSFKRDELGYWK